MTPALLHDHAEGVDEGVDGRVQRQHQHTEGCVDVVRHGNPVGSQEPHETHWEPAEEVRDGNDDQTLGDGAVGEL